MIHDDVKFPLYVHANGKSYRLFFDYKLNTKTNAFNWYVSYVGDTGILYLDHDYYHNELLTRFNNFLKTIQQ